MNKPIPRISASSYSNTAPLVWSFLYGSQHGRVELILDYAPARSAQLLSEHRVDAALVPVIAFQTIEGVRLIGDACVSSENEVRSVCLFTKGLDLESVRTVALDTSSRTSVALTKIIFREFLGKDPEFCEAEPDPGEMLSTNDCALLIGDPALSADRSDLRRFDLAGLWNRYTGLGFVFAMWMTRHAASPVDFGSARDEGVKHIDEIISNYRGEIPLNPAEFRHYLERNVSYELSEKKTGGMKLFFELAEKHGLIGSARDLEFTD